MNKRHIQKKSVMLAIVIALGLLAAAVVAADIVITKAYIQSGTYRIYKGKSFPRKSTADQDSIYSYQTNQVRISVHEYDEYPAHYFVADVWVRDLESFRCAFSNGEFDAYDQSAEIIARDNHSILAVNSDFNWGTVIRNGVLYSEDRWDMPMLVMYRNGEMKIEYDQLYTDPADLLAAGAWNTWTFGPVLVDAGENVVAEEADVLEPRTAIGYYSPGHYCFVVVDGRQKGYSSGILLADLAELMKSLGCSVAYNFDGGASSQLLAGEKYLNHPSLNPARLQKNLIVITEPETVK